MSYQVLARKYRSSNFDELVGQDHVAQTLKKAIESDRIAHAYLFCGTRGTGKTSTARILAMALNCEKSKKPTAEPCGECQSCKSIARGDDIDVIEIDAASNTGVDNVRDLINNSQFHPARSRFKVYIIDEVHMLSKAAFNALLKTLEEPPAHVKFILATTEPEKVLPTILSRCQRFDFRSIPTRQIAEHLKEICKKEKIKAEDDALMLVAKAGAGSMRDSLSLLDRLLSVGEKNVTTELVEQTLGMPKAQLIFDLADTIGQGNVKATLEQVDKMTSSGLSTDTLLASLTDHLRNLLVLRTCGPDSTLIEVPGLSMQQLQQQASQFDPVALTQDIAILEELRRTLRQSQAGRALLDATLVRLALADQFASVAQLLGSLDNRAPGKPAATPAQKKKPEPITASSDTGFQPVQTAPHGQDARVTDPPTAESEAEDDDDALPAVGKVWNSAPSSSPLLKPRSSTTSPPPASNIEPVNTFDLPAVWQRLLSLLEDNVSFKSVLSSASLVGIEDGQARVRFAFEHSTFASQWDRNGKKELLREKLSAVLNEPVGVKFEVEPAGAVATVDAPVSAPAMQTVRREIPQPATVAAPAPTAPRLTPEQREALKKEPWVKAVLEIFGGEIVKVE